MPVDVVKLTDKTFDPVVEENELVKFSNGAGAIATFKGIARPTTKAGEKLDRLILEAHPTMTLKSMQDIVSDARQRFNFHHAQIIHRHGSITPGEIIVFVGIASDHRREAFQATDFIMDHLKSDAVFWKKEEGPTFGTRWIDTTERDKSDRSRW